MQTHIHVQTNSQAHTQTQANMFTLTVCTECMQKHTLAHTVFDCEH